MKTITNNVVKNILLVLLISSLILSTTTAAVRPTPTTATVTLTFKPSDFTFDTIQGYDRINTQASGFTNEPGKPSLPAITLRVALPAGLQATSITVTSQQTQTYPGVYTIMPSQKPQTIGTDTLMPPDPDAYQSTAPYPSTTAFLAAETDLDGQAIALVTVYPIHYTPATKTLTLTTSLTLTITGTTTHVYGDYLPRHLTDAQRAQRTANLQRIVVNPSLVNLQTDPAPQHASLPAGSYAYVIITKQDWASAFQPLADWRTKTGMPAIIVTIESISANYSGGDLTAKINAFVQDAYATWGTTFFLLGGDIDTVPAHYDQFPSVDYDPVPNDTYYSDFDHDWTVEVNVGRASVTGPGTGNGGIGNFIAKTLKYEQNPEPGFATKASMFGFNLDGSTPTEICKKYIDDTWIPDTFTMTNVYDSDQGNHRDNVIAALNAGENLANHADHSGSDCMGTGYVNHDWLIYIPDMDALTNNNTQGILYSMGCDPAYFDTDCIAEHFVRNTHGGGIAFVGNTRYGWYNPGSEDTISLKFDRLFFKEIFANDCYTLGAALTAHKNEGITGDSYDQYVYTELTLLGDPATPIWTDTPGTLSVSYPSSILVGEGSYTFTVTSGGSPVGGATVCVMKQDNGVYAVGTTDSNGAVTLTLKPTTTGTMQVTVAKHNFLPYESTAAVIRGGSKLEIKAVNGGLMKVDVVLSNPGNMTTTNVVWTITLESTFLLTGTKTHGTVTSIAAGKTATVSFTPIIGFGPLTVTATARADGISTVTKTADGFLLIVFATVS